jgi:thymidine kinase
MGYLKLILGPMFSGKSTKLIELIRKYKIINYQIMILKNAIDKRYSDNAEVVSHNKESEPCVALMSLFDIFVNNNLHCQYHDSKVIFIEEAQFFGDLYEFVQKALLDDKIIFVVGLNGDSNQKNFGQIHKLLPICDDIELLKACCKVCMNETPGIMTKRTVSREEQVHVGGGDEYIAVCRKHI